VAATRRIALFVEGDTELALPAFFHAWLDPQLPVANKVGITPVKFQGITNYLDDVGAKAEMYLDRQKANVVVGVVDLYGLPPNRINLSKCVTVKDKVLAARAYIRALIPGHLRRFFRQHFAVHETEAWLLAYPNEWPPPVRGVITKRPPEEIDFNEPPAKLLARLLRGDYKKTVRARTIFGRVDPQVAIAACPYLKLLADDLLLLATALQ
jgi:hypothetical protein